MAKFIEEELRFLPLNELTITSFISNSNINENLNENNVFNIRNEIENEEICDNFAPEEIKNVVENINENNSICLDDYEIVDDEIF